jgi:sulfite exporter TauE/SafE
MTALLATAFVAGLAGSAHCFGMCGGMAGALGMRARMNASSAASTTLSATLYHLGRISGYAIIGAVGGALGHSAHWALSLTRYGNALRIAAGVLTVLIAIRILFRWNAFAPLERLGARMWQKIQPLARRASSNDRWYANVAIGLLWGWLPCGLVYSIALLTMTAASAAKGAAIMAAFGLGTLPAMLSSSLLAGTVPLLSQRNWFRHATGAAMLMFGLWMIAGPQLMHAMQAGSSHMH